MLAPFRVLPMLILILNVSEERKRLPYTFLTLAALSVSEHVSDDVVPQPKKSHAQICVLPQLQGQANRKTAPLLIQLHSLSNELYFV